MKKVISCFCGVFCLLMIVSFCWAEADVIFRWDMVIDPSLAGYALYQRKDGENYNYNEPLISLNDPVANTLTIHVPEDGIFFWVLRAFDTEKRYSESSNEVSANITQINWPKAPQGFIIFRIEATVLNTPPSQ